MPLMSRRASGVSGFQNIPRGIFDMWSSLSSQKSISNSMLSILKSQAVSWGPHTATEHFQLRPWKKSVYIWPNLVTEKSKECCFLQIKNEMHWSDHVY